MFHVGDIVEEAETKRRGRLDEAPSRPTDVRRWRVQFTDGAPEPIKYFTDEAAIVLISCPHTSDKEPRLVPDRGIMG